MLDTGNVSVVRCERSHNSVIKKRLSTASPDAKYSVVRVDALQRFEEFVKEIGGDPLELFERASISPDSLKKPNAVIPYRALINLLEKSSEKLSYPSFGLQLAVRQGGMQVLGPLEVAMQNSRTIGEAYQYCAEHLQTYSPVVQIQIEPAKASARRAIRFEILLSRIPHQQQAVEHALGLMHHAIIAISNREVRAREVWFMHEPVSSISTYRRYFGTGVSFGKPINAIFLNSSDFDMPIMNRNQQLYELATSFIDTQYPSTTNVLSAQVRVITARLLAAGKCSHVEVADTLGMHPRTLQRRLRDDGISFEDIKDEVRRDVALRYLGQRSMPLIRVATMLGYSEPSVLTRSCYRWFAKSPRKVRELLQTTEIQ